jgi:hypothetical protein
MTEKRTHCTVTMTSSLFQAVKAAAKAADQPLTVWCREALKRALQKENGLGRDF